MLACLTQHLSQGLLALSQEAIADGQVVDEQVISQQMKGRETTFKRYRR